VQRMVLRGMAEREAILVMSCPGVARTVRGGDELEVNFETGELKDLTQGIVLRGSAITGPMAELYEAGGMLPLLKKKIREGNVAARIAQVPRT
ncbi:MAG: hypothetical protein HY718_18025, partial [Planctomycetes bacterium]|nr:hypothetical protein [Planctomycetota bacterium]